MPWGTAFFFFFFNVAFITLASKEVTEASALKTMSSPLEESKS